jgi:glycosyltransferase involved in cell wall biosynthesis
MNCYNGGKYLHAALDSILAQTYQNWEVVFWDNQSTDGSAEICNSYRDSRIRYFCAREHVELGAARILAFQQIRGDFVAVLDADDVSHPERLMRQVAFLEKNPEVALVGSWVQYINERGMRFGEYKPPTNQHELHDCLGWTNPIIHSSTMYRHRLAVEVGGYSAELIQASDFGLILGLAQHCRIAIIDDFLCQLRVLSTSMSHSKKYRAIAAREALMLFQRAADLLPLSAKALRLNRRAQAIQRTKLGISSLSDGAMLPGLKLILHALLSEPSALWGNGPIRRFFGKAF